MTRLDFLVKLNLVIQTHFIVYTERKQWRMAVTNSACVVELALVIEDHSIVDDHETQPKMEQCQMNAIKKLDNWLE